jgi:hypothetical protein
VFKNTLGLVLLQSETLTWLVAAGVTSMALVAAAQLGIFLAVCRRGERNGLRLAVVMTAVTWTGLGLAMFLVRWLGTGAGTSSGTFSSLASSLHHTPLVALFFTAIYFISGACTIFEAERLYNPEYFAYVRLAKQYRRQVQKVAEAEATVERARAAVDHHDGEMSREDHRRQAAIADRHALGAEAANYARILMAAMMRDPAKTGLTETGPAPRPAVAFSRAFEIAEPEEPRAPSVQRG